MFVELPATGYTVVTVVIGYGLAPCSSHGASATIPGVTMLDGCRTRCVVPAHPARQIQPYAKGNSVSGHIPDSRSLSEV
jgi:hypothetical protein